MPDPSRPPEEAEIVTLPPAAAEHAANWEDWNPEELMERNPPVAGKYKGVIIRDSGSGE
jgi:hypothetical protein